MRDHTTTESLPTPGQMRNYFAAARAAWQTRRQRESSRAVITGNIAFVVCLLGTILVIIHSNWVDRSGSFVICGMLLAYFACLLMLLRWMKKQRAQSSVRVIDRWEAEAERAGVHPVRKLVISTIGVGVSSAIWAVAFQHMSNSAILAALAATPVLAAGFFVHRFMIFRFWEDMLFAAAVLASYTPLILQNWSLTPLSFVSLAAVIFGTICLHRRWISWARSIPTEDVEGTGEEVQK